MWIEARMYGSAISSTSSGGGSFAGPSTGKALAAAAFRKLVDLERARREHAHAAHLEVAAGRHHADARALAHGPVEDPAEDHRAVIGIEPAVEDERGQRLARVAGRRRDLPHDRLE